MKNKLTEIKKTGTTTVGIICKDAIILAADTRATAGSMILDANAEKVVKINDEMALTIAGTFSSAQKVINNLKSEIKLREIRTGRKMIVKEVANLCSNWLYGMVRSPSMIQDIVHLLLAGKDKHGFHLYDLYFDGSIAEIKTYISSGSGSVFAYGVLETQYKKELSKEEGIKLAEKCIDVAIQKDSASGNGMNLFVIDEEGAKKLLSKRVNTHLQ